MPQARHGDVAIEYDTFGDPADPAVLLVMGMGAQMTLWDDDFCNMIAGHGLFVIRFDNRDAGLSSKTPGEPPETMSIVMQALAGEEIGPAPYSLSDMAEDGLAVLDALGIERAHVVGASMGGMIAQVMAVEHPDRVASLVSIMSTTGARDVGQATPEAMATLLAPPPATREEVIEANLEAWSVIGGTIEIDQAELRKRVEAAYDRSFHPEGGAFQIAAIVKTGNLTERLATVAAPTLVIHGLEDPLVDPSGGEATAAAIPGAELVTYEGMGHILPPQLWEDVAARIAAHARAAARR